MIRTLICMKLLCGRRAPCVYQACRNAGHSKWQNIRHIKAEKDGQRSALFTKLGRFMRVAIIEGNSADPVINIKLAQVIEQAKRANMPAATINSIIKSTKDETVKSESKTVELSGPGGSAFVLYVITGNFLKVKTSLNIIIKKSKGTFSIGKVAHLFECKGIVETNIPPNTSVEDAVNLAVEIDVEDVAEIGNDNLKFTCESSIMYKIKTQLESKKYCINSAQITYKPLSPVVVQEDHLETIHRFYDKLQEITDIEEIYDNVIWPEDSKN